MSTDCCTEIYGGTQTLSEPEAQAVTYFVGSRIEDFLCFLTIHSYGQLLLVPYGNPNYTAPNYDELVHQYTECVAMETELHLCFMSTQFNAGLKCESVCCLHNCVTEAAGSSDDGGFGCGGRHQEGPRDALHRRNVPGCVV